MHGVSKNIVTPEGKRQIWHSNTAKGPGTLFLKTDYTNHSKGTRDIVPKDRLYQSEQSRMINQVEAINTITSKNKKR